MTADRAHTLAVLHPVVPQASSSGSPPAAPSPHRPETPEERHARRVAWGKKYGAYGAEIGRRIRESEA